MSPFERYLALNGLIEKISSYTGFNPFQPTWKCDKYRLFHLFAILTAMIGTFYSMYEADAGIEIVKRSFSLGIFIQTLFKCFMLLYGGDIYQKLIKQIEMLYKSNGKKTQQLMTKKINLCENFYKVISVVNSSAVLIFISYPLVKIFLSSHIPLMFPFYYPFFNTHSFLGSLATYLLHSILIIFTLLFHNAFDIAFVCFTVHAVAIVDLIKIDYDEITEFVDDANVENVLDMKYVRQKLKGIIEAQREFDSYVDNVNRLYKWPCFVTSSTSTFSICFALVLILIVKWPLGYGLCWALFGQLFAAFLNGEAINFQYGRLSQFIYAFPWQKLRVSEQKMIILMIHKASRPNLMNLMFIGPLNLETFTMICNAIYSYYNICESLLNA